MSFSDNRDQIKDIKIEDIEQLSEQSGSVPNINVYNIASTLSNFKSKEKNFGNITTIADINNDLTDMKGTIIDKDSVLTLMNYVNDNKDKLNPTSGGRKRRRTKKSKRNKRKKSYRRRR
jgi:hypothetical protein